MSFFSTFTREFEKLAATATPTPIKISAPTPPPRPITNKMGIPEKNNTNSALPDRGPAMALHRSLDSMNPKSYSRYNTPAQQQPASPQWTPISPSFMRDIGKQYGPQQQSASPQWRPTDSRPIYNATAN